MAPGARAFHGPFEGELADRNARSRSRASRLWVLLLAALAVVVLAVVAFFALGGDVSTDTEGQFDVDVETPEADVDVAPPDVDAEAPDIDVDPGSIDVQDGDAEAEAGTD